MKYIVVFIIFGNTILFAQSREIIPLSKTEFTYVNTKGIQKEIDLTGKDFILVSVREEESDGRFYAVDRDGTVWLSGGISSGEEAEFTPSGKWKVVRKERFYTSKEFPEEDGSNNMDYSLFFTWKGHALHKGNIDKTSHGCIHVDHVDIQMLYKWADLHMPVLVTRHRYMHHARSDLRRIYTTEKKYTRKRRR
ncbi:MAG: L,D-transpeptidase [Campylobacterota bacterium]|nr:L,D-transpeptidase [Campylobacterota bacterium]